jgi:hypothetical protein
MTQRPPLTDRAIRESLGEDRQVPSDLARSISDYSRSTPQRPSLPLVGRLVLRPGLAGWRPVAIAVLFLLLLLAIAVTAQIGSRPRFTAVAPSSGPSVVPAVAPSPSPSSVLAPLPVGWSHVADVPRVEGDGVAGELDGLVVIANAARGELAFLDPTAGEIVDRLRLGPSSRGLPISRGAENWWIGLGGAGEIVAFDPGTRTLGRRIAIDAEAYNLASAGPIVYVTDVENGRVLRVDTSTAKVTAAVDIEQAAGVAVLFDGSVLVASRPGRLLTLEPTSLETVEETTVQGDVMTLIPDGDRVIITRNNADRLSTIRQQRFAAGETLVETRLSSFALTDDAAWGIDWVSGDVLRLNRQRLTILERAAARSVGQDGIVAAAGDLWIEGAGAEGPVVHRLRPP